MRLRPVFHSNLTRTQMDRCYSSQGGRPPPPPQPPEGGRAVRNAAALYTDATTHVKHVPLKEGGQLLQSTDHLLQTGPLFSPIPGSWQQLAGRTGCSGPACQSVHYGEVWEPSRCQRPSIRWRDRYLGMLSQGILHTSFGNFSKSVKKKALKKKNTQKHIFNWLPPW